MSNNILLYQNIGFRVSLSMYGVKKALLKWSHENLKALFKTVNDELQRGNECFMSNKLSLNTETIFHSSFHKKGDWPLLLSNLQIDNKDNKVSACRDQRSNKKKNLFACHKPHAHICCRSEKCKIWPKIWVPVTIWPFQSPL